jgi:hypothetical protein
MFRVAANSAAMTVCMMDAWTDLSCIQVLLHQVITHTHADSSHSLQDGSNTLSARLMINVFLKNRFLEIAMQKLFH